MASFIVRYECCTVEWLNVRTAIASIKQALVLEGIVLPAFASLFSDICVCKLGAGQFTN